MQPSVVAIGNFDGVHLGHRALLREAVGLARDLGTPAPLPVIVVTFWPHPVSIVDPALAPPLLTDLPTRLELLKAGGAHEVRVVPFSNQLADQSPPTFVEAIIAPLNPLAVVVGENFRFGRQARGSAETLRSLGQGRYAVRSLPLVSAAGRTVSSTAIREALTAGDVAGAAQMLGRPYAARGVVQVGDQRGRTLGFPTANLPVQAGLVTPRDGVYAGALTRLDEPGLALPAAISVGANPTFDGRDSHVEAYVLDRDDLELYGIDVRVDFVARLRGMVRFDGVDALIAQMRRDVAATREALGRPLDS